MAIETWEEFEAWLEEPDRTQEVCTAIAARAALRVWPVFYANRFWKKDADARKHLEKLALLTGWATLSSGVAAISPTPDDKISSAARSAADAYFAARDAAYSAAGHSAARDAAAASAARDAAAYLAARDAAYSAAFRDTTFSPADMFRQPLWHDAGVPEGLRPKDLGETLLADPRFKFFARLYQGILKPKQLGSQPLDWELLRRIATEIPPETWEEGIDAVNEAIADIQDNEDEDNRKRRREYPRAPEFEPDTVAHLFDYPLSVSGSLRVAANSITVGFEQFRAKTGLNETPEFLEPLESMPASMERIAEIVGTQVRTSVTEQALREEIGRWMSKCAMLEAKLAQAERDLELKSKPWFGQTAVLGLAVTSIVGALWTVSGDDIGAKQRMETLLEYWEVGKGLFVNQSEESPAPLAELPPITDV